MKFSEYKKLNNSNMGLGELLYTYKYRQNCRAPNKLSLFKFTKKIGIKQAALLHQGDMIDGLPENLPESFCLKPIDGAGARGVFLIHNGINIKDNEKYTKEEIQKKYIEDTTFYVGYSTKYYIEDLLLTDGDIPDDISFFMINDQIGSILQAKRIGKNKGKVFYDSDWNVIGSSGNKPKKPNLNLRIEMNNTVKQIMVYLKVPFLRIDMYAVKDKGCFLGELAAVSGVPSKLPSSSFLEIDDGILLDKYLGYLLKDSLFEHLKKIKKIKK